MKLSLRSPALILTMLLAAVTAFSIPAFTQAAQLTTLDGWFSTVYGLPEPGSADQSEKQIFMLSTDDGRSFELNLTPSVLQAAGGFAVLNGSYVRVTISAQTDRDVLITGGTVTVESISMAPLPLRMPPGVGSSRAVLGSQPWVTILCAFPGTPVGYGTQDVPYFQGMYSDQKPGMDHYWRQQSFGKVNMVGSQTFGWFTLDSPQTDYYPTPGVGSNVVVLDRLAQDCIDKADPTVDFSSFKGINFMFNGSLDAYAWGGAGMVTTDAVYSYWRMTWNPPFSWRDITVVSHEIGHGFGLPHANNYDGDNNPYDNTWDVMSETYYFCSKSYDPAYGCLGQHTNAFHKDHLGWFAPAQRLTLNADRDNIVLDHVAMQNPQNYQIVIIPIPGTSKKYVVEARQTANSNYDAKLAGKAVIIHEIDMGRQQWAWLVGGTTDAKSRSLENNQANPDGAWLVGETFNDAAKDISISVVSETANGFVISVDMPFVPVTPTPTTPPIPPTLPPTANLIRNGGMEAATDNGSLPDDWAFKNLTKDKLKCDNPAKNKFFAYAGNCAFMFKGGPGEVSKLTQTYTPTASLSGTLSTELYTQGSNEAVNGKFTVKVFYSNGGKAKLKVSVLPSASYTRRTGTLKLNGSVTKIKFILANSSTGGKVFIDNVKAVVN